MTLIKSSNKNLALALSLSLATILSACKNQRPVYRAPHENQSGDNAKPVYPNPDPSPGQDSTSGETSTPVTPAIPVTPTTPTPSGGAQNPTPAPSTTIDPALTPVNELPVPEKGKGVLVKVANKCPFPLWIHAAGAQGVLQPDDAELKSGTVRSYEAPILWTSARVEAYRKGPRTDQIEKVEMTFDHPAQTVNLNYNVTYVDWVGLPVKVSSIGSGPDCKVAGCERPIAKLLDGCPDGLNDGERCVSARSYCLDPQHKASAYCHLLDAKVNECVNKYDDCKAAAGSGTPEVYACSGSFFSENPKYCAAINRGMLDDPQNTNIALYHTKPPFNSYSKWVHDVCPGIYALAYDDYPPAAEESGFHACVDGTEMDITFCPGG